MKNWTLERTSPGRSEKLGTYIVFIKSTAAATIKAEVVCEVDASQHLRIHMNKAEMLPRS